MAFSMTTLFYPLVITLLIIIVYFLRKNYRQSNQQVREETRRRVNELLRQMEEVRIRQENRERRRMGLSEEEKVIRREFILTRVDVKKIVSNETKEIAPNEIKLQDIQKLHDQNDYTLQENENKAGMIQQLIQSLSVSNSSSQDGVINNHSEKDPYHDKEAPATLSPSASPTKTTKGKTNSPIKAACPICLDTYQIGDDVIFSRNNDCPHTFHLDCMMEWLLMPTQDEEDENWEEGVVRCRDDCPLCRVDYLKFTKIVDEEKGHGGDL